jgi:RNA polymerase sigma-70 factor, ECF subfamily
MQAVAVEMYERQHQVEADGKSGIQSIVSGRASDRNSWGPPRLVAQMVGQHSRFVWCLLRRLGVAVSALDDATQQVFIVAARRIEDVPEGRERAFLYGTAVRVAANFRRAQGTYGSRRDDAPLDELQGGAPSGEALLEQMQARRVLDVVLDSMMQDLRTVFVLSEIEGLTAPEVAAIVDVPVGTVSSRLRRAREQFRLEAARVRDAYFSGEAL